MGKVIKLDQRVEIIAQDVEELKSSGGGGGGTSEGYTKAEADAKFETITNAAATYQTISGMSSYGTKTWAAESFQPIGDYLTETDIADMATKTWVGQQGYLTDADEVPAITSTDGGKFLRANYYNATGTSDYTWETIPTPANMEETTNKVTSLSSSSTDTQYPSAKCVYDLIGDVETILATLTTPSV